MSANYWESTQRKYWQYTKDELAAKRQQLEDDNAELVRMFPLPHPRHMAIYFNQQLIRLAKRLNSRQQAISTAQVFLKRYYTLVEIRTTNPHLLITTAIYVAGKVEETPQHIRLVVTEARQIWQDYTGLDVSKVGECEYKLVGKMNAQLIVHQPYRNVSALRAELCLMDEDVSLAKQLINDYFMTDLPIIYSPHIIAMVAILLALVLRPSPSNLGPNTSSAAAAAAGLAAAQAALSQVHASRSGQGSLPPTDSTGGGNNTASDLKEKQQEARILRVQSFVAWLADSSVDIAAMVDATQEIISFYECYEQYNDKLTREQINRFVKACNLDK